jgi:hypothetical protein
MFWTIVFGVLFWLALCLFIAQFVGFNGKD